MMKIKLIVIAAVIALTSSSAYAAENLSLSNAIERSLESNYSIRIIAQNERIAETNNSWGAAGRLPSIDFTLSTNNRYDLNEGPDQLSNSLTPGIGLNWTLFNGFAIRINKEKLETLELLSRGGTAVLVERTVQSVVAAYYRALLEKEKLALFDDIMKLSGDRYDYTETRKEIGNAVTFDVLQAKNAWLEDKAAFLAQGVTVKNSLRDLTFLMGESGDSDYELTDSFDAPLESYDFKRLKSKMLDGNRSLANQYINNMLIEQDQRLAKSAYYPRLSLRSGVDAFGSRTKTGSADAVTRNWQDAYLNLSLSYSLFDGGAKKRASRIADIRHDTSGIETDEMIHSLTNDLAKLFDLYTVRKELYDVAGENIDAAKLNLDISADRFRAGTINSFNYRDVQLIYLNAALGQLRAIYDLIDTDLALTRLTGGIVTERE